MITSASRIVAAVAGMLAIAAACSSPPQEAQRDIDIFAVDIAFFMEDLEHTGANQSQRDAIMEAVNGGGMSYDTIEELFLEYVECLELSGFTVSQIGPATRHEGFLEPDARFSLPEHMDESRAFDIETQCYWRHYSTAYGFFVSQPSSIDAYLETFETQREYVLACLDESGIDVDEQATRLELLYAVSEASARYPSEPLCWQGSVFSEIHPPGVDPVEFYPPELQEQIRKLQEEAAHSGTA